MCASAVHNGAAQSRAGSQSEESDRRELNGARAQSATRRCAARSPLWAAPRSRDLDKRRIATTTWKEAEQRSENQTRWCARQESIASALLHVETTSADGVRATSRFQTLFGCWVVRRSATQVHSVGRTHDGGARYESAPLLSHPSALSAPLFPAPTQTPSHRRQPPAIDCAAPPLRLSEHALTPRPTSGQRHVVHQRSAQLVWKVSERTEQRAHARRRAHAACMTIACMRCSLAVPPSHDRLHQLFCVRFCSGTQALAPRASVCRRPSTPVA